VLTNILIIDDARTYSGQDVAVSLVESLSVFVVINKEARTFRYIKNKFFGHTDTDYPLANLDAHLVALNDICDNQL
jgi:hypothetical protein